MDKKIIIGGAIALGGLATFFIVKNAKKRNLEKQLKQDQTKAQSDTDGQNKTQVQAYVPVNSGFPLKYGSRGENVKKIQAFLNQKTKAGLKEDGIWGDNTEKAVKAAIGANQVTESMFKQYIGQPALIVSASAGSGSGISKGINLNPISNFIDAASKAFSFFKK